MKVIGMGDNVVDRYVHQKRMFPGGNAVNFAAYASMCDIESAFMGNVADDLPGRLIWNSLQSLKIDVSMSRLLKGYDTKCCDVVLQNGERFFQETSEAAKEYAPSLVLGEKEIEYLKSFHLIHCGCYAGMEDEVEKLQGLGSLRSFDFSEEDRFREEIYLEKVCPSIDMALFSGAFLDEKKEEELVSRVSSYGVCCILITHGVDGQTLYLDNRNYCGEATVLDRVVDTLGAGDSFFTGFVSSLLKGGWSREHPPSAEMIEGAFSFACGFSARICSAEGAYGFGTDYD